MGNISKILVIDGNNLLHRAYWTADAVPSNTPTTHIYIFLNLIKSYIDLFSPRKIIVCWDFRENQTDNYRKMLDENYKAQRDQEAQKKVYQYMPIIIQLLNTLGITQINPLTLEADDIIFWLSTEKYPNECVVISSDTDMYQLVSDKLPGNIIYNPKKKREVNQLFLKEYFNVDNGAEYIIQKALKGDKADNLVGVKGIRSSKIQDIISILKIDCDLNGLQESGLLKEDDLNRFKHNLRLMVFSANTISEEERNWYEECIANTPIADKEAFTLLIKELEFWTVYRKIDFWFNKFNRIDLSDVFASLFATED